MKRAVEFERHEAKYVIHPSLVQPIRDFINPFCVPDSHGMGTPPEYLITTLQLDTAAHSLHHAKDQESLHRFKLRCRSYGLDHDAPFFLEIKRKCKGFIYKSRSRVPRKFWNDVSQLSHGRSIPFRSQHERLNYLEFIRLVKETGARPSILIRYTRESYESVVDTYARVSFDRKLLYTPTHRWELGFGRKSWHSMDTSFALNRPFSGVILELKTFKDAPRWMVDLTERFDLVRSGFCKYSTAVGLESYYAGGWNLDDNSLDLMGVA